jgi:hypothetical protein
MNKLILKFLQGSDYFIFFLALSQLRGLSGFPLCLISKYRVEVLSTPDSPTLPTDCLLLRTSPVL